MKIPFSFLILVAVIAATGVSSGQTYTLLPNDTVTVNAVMEDLQTLSIQQINVSSGVVQFKWKKLSATVPSNWEASTCDNRFCNTSLADSGMMVPVDPEDYGFLLIHCTPHVNYGTAVIRYAVWDVSFPNDQDTLTYIIDASSTGILTSGSFRPIIWMSEDKIHLKDLSEDIQEIRVYDVSGKTVSQRQVWKQQEFDLAGLISGVYTVQASGNGKQYQQKMLYNR